MAVLVLWGEDAERQPICWERQQLEPSILLIIKYFVWSSLNSINVGDLLIEALEGQALALAAVASRYDYH